MTKECSNCRWFNPVDGGDWKYDSGAYGKGITQLVYHLQDKNMRVSPHGWPGKCSVEPAQTDVRSSYACSRWTVTAEHRFLQTINGVLEQRKMITRIAELEKELKTSKALSIERYRKLQLIKAQSATKPPPEATSEGS